MTDTDTPTQCYCGMTMIPAGNATGRHGDWIHRADAPCHEVEAATDDRPAGERLDDATLGVLQSTHNSAKALLAAKRAERAALNDEIRILVATENKARRALAIYTKATTP